MDKLWDCVIIGGGAAGLSAALVLGRARRRTLVVDAGAQSNLAATGIGGLLGFDGVPPGQLYAQGRSQLAPYPSVEVRDGEVVTGEASDGGFTLELADGGVVQARRVLLAMGMRYEAPSLPGLAELWGRSVFHCPFCHGWEVRERPLAVLANGERAAHMATLLRGWSDDVVLLTGGPAELTDADRSRLAEVGVAVDERAVSHLVSASDELAAVVFADGTSLGRRGLLVAVTLHQRSALAAKLGVSFAAPGPVSVEAIEIDAMHRTSVPGVFAAGDACVQMPQVAAAVAAGSAAAASIVASFINSGEFQEER
ncbi:NAD(P)/FAD-dependent oxidoreductase [Mycolicibacterium austroafricanum]|uniref:NAD(P)/FAD-dependent oxidoreductase n=1 Tax=Mycolicibacterium austroafricanum TaxID=39687 RepID=A0ABT8HG86_MYCAO|nr:NAD(P)/FAD-dependent oxidoreductase [Mycolicibacterium austroafricanum]MDN4519775.1 NAD(P)/FAD-dependent oxidoreductase [Mycolicibacterium austroafricanum]PQP48249.1 NAD(P)/FAD-dependent oxidoreductase [Mycolicibacterium austroafricanum]QRZ05063.1 NAD(P)/FAD-dependent oxidoreductase [Mycolicibacterium austroafricanum]QZT66373.1 NAD(P)/FAD-dependent oxidoreductase [Mycolicibacterium austroafricanum]